MLRLDDYRIDVRGLLLDPGKTSDVVFLVENNKPVHAHMAVLHARVPHLSQRLEAEGRWVDEQSTDSSAAASSAVEVVSSVKNDNNNSSSSGGGGSSVQPPPAPRRVCTLRIPEFTYEAFFDLMMFIYTGTLQFSEKYMVDVWLLAKTYSLKRAMGLCIQAMVKNLDNNNVLFILQSAHRSKISPIKVCGCGGGCACVGVCLCACACV